MDISDMMLSSRDLTFKFIWKENKLVKQMGILFGLDNIETLQQGQGCGPKFIWCRKENVTERDLRKLKLEAIIKNKNKKSKGSKKDVLLLARYKSRMADVEKYIKKIKNDGMIYWYFKVDVSQESVIFPNKVYDYFFDENGPFVNNDEKNKRKNPLYNDETAKKALEDENKKLVDDVIKSVMEELGTLDVLNNKPYNAEDTKLLDVEPYNAEDTKLLDAELDKLLNNKKDLDCEKRNNISTTFAYCAEVGTQYYGTCPRLKIKNYHPEAGFKIHPDYFKVTDKPDDFYGLTEWRQLKEKMSEIDLIVEAKKIMVDQNMNTKNDEEVADILRMVPVAIGPCFWPEPDVVTVFDNYRDYKLLVRNHVGYISLAMKELVPKIFDDKKRTYMGISVSNERYLMLHDVFHHVMERMCGRCDDWCDATVLTSNYDLYKIPEGVFEKWEENRKENQASGTMGLDTTPYKEIHKPACSLSPPFFMSSGPEYSHENPSKYIDMFLGDGDTLQQKLQACRTQNLNFLSNFDKRMGDAEDVYRSDPKLDDWAAHYSMDEFHEAYELLYKYLHNWTMPFDPEQRGHDHFAEPSGTQQRDGNAYGWSDAKTDEVQNATAEHYKAFATAWYIITIRGGVFGEKNEWLSISAGCVFEKPPGNKRIVDMIASIIHYLPYGDVNWPIRNRTADDHSHNLNLPVEEGESSEKCRIRDIRKLVMNTFVIAMGLGSAIYGSVGEFYAWREINSKVLNISNTTVHRTERQQFFDDSPAHAQKVVILSEYGLGRAQEMADICAGSWGGLNPEVRSWLCESKTVKAIELAETVYLTEDWLDDPDEEEVGKDVTAYEEHARTEKPERSLVSSWWDSKRKQVRSGSFTNDVIGSGIKAVLAFCAAHASKDFIDNASDEYGRWDGKRTDETWKELLLNQFKKVIEKKGNDVDGWWPMHAITEGFSSCVNERALVHRGLAVSPALGSDERIRQFKMELACYTLNEFFHQNIASYKYAVHGSRLTHTLFVGASVATHGVGRFFHNYLTNNLNGFQSHPAIMMVVSHALTIAKGLVLEKKGGEDIVKIFKSLGNALSWFDQHTAEITGWLSSYLLEKAYDYDNPQNWKSGNVHKYRSDRDEFLKEGDEDWSVVSFQYRRAVGASTKSTEFAHQKAETREDYLKNEGTKKTAEPWFTYFKIDGDDQNHVYRENALKKECFEHLHYPPGTIIKHAGRIMVIVDDLGSMYDDDNVVKCLLNYFDDAYLTRTELAERFNLSSLFQGGAAEIFINRTKEKRVSQSAFWEAVWKKWENDQKKHRGFESGKEWERRIDFVNNGLPEGYRVAYSFEDRKIYIVYVGSQNMAKSFRKTSIAFAAACCMSFIKKKKLSTEKLNETFALIFGAWGRATLLGVGLGFDFFNGVGIRDGNFRIWKGLGPVEEIYNSTPTVRGKDQTYRFKDKSRTGRYFNLESRDDVVPEPEITTYGVLIPLWIDHVECPLSNDDDYNALRDGGNHPFRGVLWSPIKGVTYPFVGNEGTTFDGIKVYPTFSFRKMVWKQNVYLKLTINSEENDTRIEYLHKYGPLMKHLWFVRDIDTDKICAEAANEETV